MQAITGSGLTGHTTPRCVFNIFYSWPEQVQSKVHATGGLADIVRTIDIPTPTLIHTTRNGVSCGHIGWTIFRIDLRPGAVDISDLQKDPLVQWQHLIVAAFGYVLPSVIPGVLWGDWNGGICFAGALRMTCCHHVGHLFILFYYSAAFIERLVQSTSSINSIAHWFGETSYDDKHSPRDHLITALLTSHGRGIP